MVKLGCQVTNWVGGNDKEVLDAIFLQDGLILVKSAFLSYFVSQNISKKF